MSNTEQVRKQIYHLLDSATNEDYRLRLPMVEVADQILAIPEVLVKAEDQSLPIDESSMARQFPEIFDGSLCLDRYSQERERYLNNTLRTISDMLKTDAEGCVWRKVELEVKE